MAKQRYPRSEAIRNAEISKTAGYVTWDEGNDTQRAHAFKEFSLAMSEFGGISKGGHWTDFSNLDTNTSGRPGLTRRDYEQFRPHEAAPTKQKDIIQRADTIYQRVGLIRNIIDLMGDFACQGIRLVHPNKRIERFFRNWFIRVQGKERSERFLNLLYRQGNVVVRKQTARISVKDKEKIFRASGKPDLKVEHTEDFGPTKEIPWRYTFLDPSTIAVAGGPLASFVPKPIYGLLLPHELRRLIRNPKTTEEKAIVDQLPDEYKLAAKTNQLVPLPPDKTSVWHYKKDDWRTWANPMIYSIMDDITILEKLKLAYIAAIDGAISNIRIFKLGSLEHKIMPTRAAAAKLSNILENNVGGGTMDLVWGPDIELVESKTTVHQFLGEGKYTPHLNAIYTGLGIPPTLTGTLAGGTTNNFVSLKTLVKRLEYGRDVLRTFWEQEIRLVQKAMDFRLPAKVEFANINLGDEEAERSLWLQLYDRNLASDEQVQLQVGADPDLEKVRLNREHRDRESGKMVPKSSPYHDPQFGVALKKIALQTGVSTPGQVGLRKEHPCAHLKTDNKEEGEKPGLMMKQPTGPPGAKKKGPSGQGRPKNSKDSTTRKPKTFKPKNKAVVELWAQAAQVAIADTLNPGFLKTHSKKNMRSLSTEQLQEAEIIKFDILCHLEPLGPVNEEVIYSEIKKGKAPTEVHETMQQWVQDVSQELDRKLTLVECRQLQAAVYVAYCTQE